MKKFTLLLVFGLCAAFCLNVAAQEKNVATGTVKDAKTSETLPGAVIKVKNSSDYAVTDDKGKFSLPVPGDGKTIVVQVSMMGYRSDEFALVTTKENVLTLTLDADILNESQVIAYGKQSKLSVTGAMSSVGTQDLLKSPAGSVGASLAGLLTGISTVQVSGQPGAEDPQIYVRGSGSLTSSASQPLILVDGIERSFFQMDANEIESITVLKDAASTAVFGVRGANGVILVTTRRGEKGKTKISVDASFGITQPLRNIDGVDSYTYGLRYNEAQLNDDPNMNPSQLKFSKYILERFQKQDEPTLFPSVNWEDYIFNDVAWQTHENVNISGGSDRVRYFVSLGYLHEDGMVKQYYENYNSNFRYDRFNYRANVDADLTKTTKLTLNLGGRLGARSEPDNDDMWQKIMWCVPFAGPGFVDGIHVNNSGNGYIDIAGAMDGLQLYYNWGYKTISNNVFNLDAAIDQDLCFVTPGLSIGIKGAYNSSYAQTIHRMPVGTDSGACAMYLGTLTTPGLSMDDPNFDHTIIYKTDNVKGLKERMSYAEWYDHGRDWYIDARVNYDRTFGDHHVTALFLYNQNKFYYPSQYQDIPRAYLGFVGRATYSYKDRYFVDLNAGYNGSENFAPDKRFGFFPSGSAAWVISEEKWMKQQNVIDLLKIRVSYGLVGNDKYSGDRFLYMDGSWNSNSYAHDWGWKYNTVPGSYQFGDGSSPDKVTEATEGSVGNSEVTWEKCAKQNYGIDLKLFDYRFDFSFDYFFEHRWDILSTRNTLSCISAVDLPLVNLGVVDNQGFEISTSWMDKIAGQVRYKLTGNVSYAKNKIVYMDEVAPNEPYMAQTGLQTGLNYGYQFDRFLTPADFKEDGSLVDGIPSQGDVVLKPGDACYKDLNGDGIVNSDDCTYFGNPYTPNWVIGFLMHFDWKGIALDMQWTAGVGASRLLQGEYRDAFGSQNGRMLLKYLSDGRCCEENGYQGRFPRLSFANKNFNQRTSDLWMLDGSYLRLKTIELSYTFDPERFPWMRKAAMSGLKVYFNAYNPLTLFAEMTKYDLDPEGSTGDYNWQYYYPNSRIFNFGVNINF